ncbi:hypothetical protein [Ferrovum myxofaciens]|uniref:hypothetical protein n=1 Tax=Ferrovum myxofaciens TaxID=416213 RepID=UPI003EB8AAAD
MILIDTQQKFEKGWILKDGLAHNGRVFSWETKDSPLRGLPVKFFEGAQPPYPHLFCKKPPKPPSNRLIALNRLSDASKTVLLSRFVEHIEIAPELVTKLAVTYLDDPDIRQELNLDQLPGVDGLFSAINIWGKTQRNNSERDRVIRKNRIGGCRE